MDPGHLVQAFVAGFIPFLFSLCVHEFSHGWVANRLGDPTAKLMGRLTLNPVAHADIMGTVLFPLIGIFTGLPTFGWAKPVPVNGRNLKNERMGMFWISLAGPGSNIILALIGTFVFVGSARYVGPEYQNTISSIAMGFIQINLLLAVFNVIPVYPLDGAKIFAIFFPESVNRKIEELSPAFSMLFILLLFTGGLGAMLMPPMHFLFKLMMHFASLVIPA